VGEKIMGINPAKLTIEKTTTPKDLLPPEELIFGRNFTGNRSNDASLCFYG
jgi:branched-chain amino acid aminotransferase